MIKIQNKIEVLAGNKILVPGCEPSSAFSPTLDTNRDCKAAVVDLVDALEAVPGSTVIYMSNPRRKFFVLPSGPAPSPDICRMVDCTVNDWYQKLRDISSDVSVESLSCSKTMGGPKSVGEICSSFPLRGIF